jgi:hypothetical protein
MDAIRTDVDQLVLVRLRVTRQHVPKLSRLTSDDLLLREPSDFAVRNPPETIFGDFGSHVPMLRVNDEVRVLIIEFVKVIVRLQRIMSLDKAYIWRDKHLHS